MQIYRDERGNKLMQAELPEDYTVTVSAGIEEHPVNRILKVRLRAVRGSCEIGYDTGDTYLYEKRKLPDPFGFLKAQQQAAQNDSGFILAVPQSLRADLDHAAASAAGGPVTSKAYYDLSQTLKAKAQKEFDRQTSAYMEDLRSAMSIASISVANIIRNYLLDGALGIYECGGKTVAVCLFRVGVEMDTVLGQGILEDLSGAPFGQADPGPAQVSNATWNIPYIAYMVSSDPGDLKTFLHFADTVDLTDDLVSFRDQLALQVRQFQMQQAQMQNMQTQAQINSMFAMQQQQFAAMDRMRDSMSRDLDQWRASQAQMRAQSDARFAPSSSQGESSDDRIQRWRHESMMGVETYERDDGTEVEFSNRAERVFENDLDTTARFGTHNYFDDYVPDGWHELKPKD